MPINVPKMAAIVRIIGMAVLSFELTEMMRTMGSANATEIRPPCNRRTTWGRSIFTMMIATKKYCRKADRLALRSNFWMIMGVMSMIPARIPIRADNSSVSIIVGYIVKFRRRRSWLRCRWSRFFLRGRGISENWVRRIPENLCLCSNPPSRLSRDCPPCPTSRDQAEGG